MARPENIQHAPAEMNTRPQNAKLRRQNARLRELEKLAKARENHYQAKLEQLEEITNPIVVDQRGDNVTTTPTRVTRRPAVIDPDLNSDVIHRDPTAANSESLASTVMTRGEALMPATEDTGGITVRKGSFGDQPGEIVSPTASLGIDSAEQAEFSIEDLASTLSDIPDHSAASNLDYSMNNLKFKVFFDLYYGVYDQGNQVSGDRLQRLIEDSNLHEDDEVFDSAIKQLAKHSFADAIAQGEDMISSSLFSDSGKRFQHNFNMLMTIVNPSGEFASRG